MSISEGEIRKKHLDEIIMEKGIDEMKKAFDQWMTDISNRYSSIQETLTKEEMSIDQIAEALLDLLDPIYQTLKTERTRILKNKSLDRRDKENSLWILQTGENNIAHKKKELESIKSSSDEQIDFSNILQLNVRGKNIFDLSKEEQNKIISSLQLNKNEKTRFRFLQDFSESLKKATDENMSPEQLLEEINKKWKKYMGPNTPPVTKFSALDRVIKGLQKGLQNSFVRSVQEQELLKNKISVSAQTQYQAMTPWYSMGGISSRRQIQLKLLSDLEKTVVAKKGKEITEDYVHSLQVMLGGLNYLAWELSKEGGVFRGGSKLEKILLQKRSDIQKILATTDSKMSENECIILFKKEESGKLRTDNKFKSWASEAVQNSHKSWKTLEDRNPELSEERRGPTNPR